MSSWYSSDFRGSRVISSSGQSAHSSSIDSSQDELGSFDDFLNLFSPETGSLGVNHTHTAQAENYQDRGSIQPFNEIQTNQVCGSATHNDLIRNNNMAYYRLLHAHSVLQDRHHELRTLYNQLQETIKNLSTSTVSTGLLQASTTSARKGPKREDVPNVKFFYQRGYKSKLKQSRARAEVLDPSASSSKQKGGTRLAANNENVQMDYIEDEDGVVVNGDTAKQIRGLARSILIEIDSVDSMKLPPSWSNIGITERTYFVDQMYKHYPILNLCDNDWKVHYLASRALSTYHEHIKRKEKAIAIKSEPKEMSVASNMSDSATSALPIPTKRKAPTASSSEPHSAKRLREASLLPAPAKTMADTASVSVSMTPKAPDAPFHFSSSPFLTSPPCPIVPALSSLSLPPPPCPPPPFPAVLSMSPRPSVSSPPPLLTEPPLPVHDPVSSHSSLPAQQNSSPPQVQSQATEADKPVQPGPLNSEDSMEGSDLITVENPFTSLFGPAIGPAVAIEALSVTKPKRGGGKKGISTLAAAAVVDDVPKATERSEPAKARRKRMPKKSRATISEDQSIDDDGNDEDIALDTLSESKEPGERPGGRSGTRSSTKSTNSVVDGGNADASAVAGCGPQIVDPTGPPSGTLKKMTRSVAPKNLCYIDYLKTNNATTTAIFDDYWKGLGKAGQKVYNDRSKLLKAADNSSGT